MKSPPIAATAEHLLSSSRYRHPGDVIRLISAASCSPARSPSRGSRAGGCSGTAAAVPGGLGTAGRVITGLVQVACLAAVAVVVAATLRRRRFRLLAGLTVGAAAAAVLAEGIFVLVGDQRPAALTAHLANGSWPSRRRVPRAGAVRVRGGRDGGSRAVAEGRGAGSPGSRYSWLPR